MTSEYVLCIVLFYCLTHASNYKWSLWCLKARNSATIASSTFERRSAIVTWTKRARNRLSSPDWPRHAPPFPSIFPRVNEILGFGRRRIDFDRRSDVDEGVEASNQAQEPLFRRYTRSRGPPELASISNAFRSREDGKGRRYGKKFRFRTYTGERKFGFGGGAPFRGRVRKSVTSLDRICKRGGCFVFRSRPLPLPPPPLPRQPKTKRQAEATAAN